MRGGGEPVQLVVAEDVDDEARQIVDRIKAWTGWDPADERAPGRGGPFAVNLDSRSAEERQDGPVGCGRR